MVEFFLYLLEELFSPFLSVAGRFFRMISFEVDCPFKGQAFVIPRKLKV